MLALALLALVLVGPGQARADGPRAVQPGDRLSGQWRADMDSMRDYLTSVLEPIGGHCLSIHGSMIYGFRTTGDPRLHAMEHSVAGTTVTIKRQRARGTRSDTVVFLYSGSYSAPLTVRAGERILETSRNPDFSNFFVEGFSVNGVFVGEMDFDLTGLSQAFGGNVMRYEFVGDNTLRLTPIFPPSPDGVPIHPRPFILHRLSHDPDRR
ncbi:MAG: hypothetical protein HY910_02810 [Desulfarculus sp.]|nr:hypothetical protein [Desulfarculus sp.]